MTLLVVVYENICGKFFFSFAVFSTSLIPQPFSVSFSLGTKNLGKIVTVQNHLYWGKKVGREYQGGLKKRKHLKLTKSGKLGWCCIVYFLSL